MDTPAKIKKLHHNIKNSIKLKDCDKEFIAKLTNKQLLDIIDVYDTHLEYLTKLIIDLN